MEKMQLTLLQESLACRLLVNIHDNKIVHTILNLWNNKKLAHKETGFKKGTQHLKIIQLAKPIPIFVHANDFTFFFQSLLN